MGYRCVNDLFNYCSGEPKKKCRLDPKTCGKHQTLKEQKEQLENNPVKAPSKSKRLKKGTKE